MQIAEHILESKIMEPLGLQFKDFKNVFYLWEKERECVSASRSKGRGRTRGRGRLLGAWVAQDPGTLTWAESRCLTLLSHPGAPYFFSLNLYCDFSLTPFFWNPKLHRDCDLLASEILFVFINHMKGKQQKQLEYSHCNPAVKDKLSLPAMFFFCCCCF